MTRGIKFYRKWYTQSFSPAIKRLYESGKITKAAFDRLNKPVEQYEFDYK